MAVNDIREYIVYCRYQEFLQYKLECISNIPSVYEDYQVSAVYPQQRTTFVCYILNPSTTPLRYTALNRTTAITT